MCQCAVRTNTGMTNITKKKMDPDLRKKSILACAKKLFSKNGYYETQISDIVKEADIARGTLYQYFKNKDDIFETLMNNFYRQWEDTVSLVNAGIDLKTIDPVEFFRYRVKMTLVFFESDADLCNIVLKMGQGLSKHFDSIIKIFEKKIVNLISGDLELGIRNGNVRNDLNVEIAASLLSGAIMRVAYDFFAVKRKSWQEYGVEKITEEISKIFTAGIFSKNN